MRLNKWSFFALRRQLLCGTLLLCLFMQHAPTTTAVGHGNTFMPALECYDQYGRPQRCMPEFINAAYQLQIEATNTCGENGDNHFCIQTMNPYHKNCEICRYEDHHPAFLTDLHDPQNPTWWQSETMYEGIQHPNHVNLTLHLGKSYDITYVRILFRSPRPESFTIYKRTSESSEWIPYQYYSADCRDTYSMTDSRAILKGEVEAHALCTSEYSDISPLRDGEIAFSTLEGRPSGIIFERSSELQEWVTATDIRITLDRLNTFGDELFYDPQVLKSYFYAISDIAVGARCKCNGHASKCVASTGMHGERTLVCECRHNTDGPDCEKCLPLYNDIKWKRATSTEVNECKACNCNGFADKCFFDAHLFNLTGHGGHCLDCRENRDGPNCERCKENFYMREDGYCINCNCDPVGSRSLQCNSHGKCQCKPGVTGEKCDRCDNNYYQFGQHGCQHCGCDPRGSADNVPSCNPNSGICHCKENVEGKRCNECKPGFFNLDQTNRFGCTPCFCYGHTSECQTAPGYSVVSVTSNFNKHKERWTAIDLYNRDVDIKYNQYSRSIGTTAQGNEYIYFLAPERFLGDQRASYNRDLKFKLQLVGQVAPSTSASDIILEGAGTKISLPIFGQGNGMPDQSVKEYSFRLHEHRDYQWQPSQSSRGFLSILSNLTAIKIRATYSVQGEAILDDVELQTAHRGAAGQPATWIEQCTCPEGYLGQFCESCAPGYRHSPARGGPFMPCIPCDCNGHAEICDSETGRCICQHNTAGDNCDQCARGYYGNALGGTPYDCKRCPCPNDGACMQINGDTVICTECPIGYYGARCEMCSDGFFGDPTGLYGAVQTCKACDCNGNVDPNAVGNCNRTTGECLKCIHNTAGQHCDECLPGHFGDPLALPHGQCDRCTCYPPGTEQNQDGITQCDQVTGQCHCKPNIIGRDCSECQPGYFNIMSGNGCENCMCDPIGSYNSTCDKFTGQCFCKPGVVGQHCDQCEVYHYGFSQEGCKACECDESGSKGFQCDQYGQCPCNDNVEGRRCDRCKENKYDRHLGCIDCPDCYNLVQDAANEHRAKLRNLSATLDEIARTPVTNDDEFEAKLKTVQEKVDILLTDAKYGAGESGQTYAEVLDDLHKRLNNIRTHLVSGDELQDKANDEIEKARQNYTNAHDIIEAAKSELQTALNLLNDDGAQALAKAKNKSVEFGVQSDQISEISREARALADRLEAEAQVDLKNAKDANEAVEKAYELAKSAINLQQKVSDELRSEVRLELNTVKQSLNNVAQTTKEALRKANEVYDAALTLLTDVNGLTAPEIDIKQLKKEALEANEEADRLLERVNDISNSNGKIFADFDDEYQLADVLILRANEQKEDDIRLLKTAQDAFDKATKAVEQGDNTLKEANNTYHTLAGFQADVQKSSEKADLALKTVPSIELEIENAEQLIRQAGEALMGANKNALEAKTNAQSAQEKYAEQASKDAEIIRKKANDTKVNARKLRDEADQLNHRVQITESSIVKLDKAANKDDNLVDDAKRNVGQAKAGAQEAQTQIDKSIQELDDIKEELENLKDINVDDLDKLENRLDSVELELNRVNLTGRIEKFRDLRNAQKKWIDKYEKDLYDLEEQVANIRAIAQALPNDCYSRSRLEP
ncbi:laminin subunit gamma-1 [Bactrocera neohumeralis]|uniref:laminin subunit gamma-1 n=1 Tax=Bactrocera tryoni TaxID=59916 RepID=UPI001A99D7B1|nr:laminin subunit gamma-1 [Bactrocera tryoni]XP_039963357.1 laminin subunit gamma-1 [Bactrocera tryoni]XP_039963358.1 laminin subunit gamma-1 [Bactrocera tryoni]XP_039963359.1 laminin subunit gamma-1 [Bactrocera tryoni]XP_039963360.1 laminin subunit gamma-1 [Bactrocera tryoni]XP_050332941.1 laminin subunit gamma-1 [Bactrocera neohumeralis]XP_050332942.1 laminin subunit gamma-1 [Bactrocera neohumeralis]XP_050332943.1 laminin subunit gamma-1 [Bactrocera neohumeralis]